MNVIDSHCHLNHNRLIDLGGASGMVKAANEAGVSGMLTICCRMAEEPDTLKAITDANKNVWCTIGTHPHDAGEAAEKAFSEDDIVALATSHPKIVGIGESGLDYFYKHSEPDDQQASFRRHIRACIRTGLPLVIHARDADQDIIRILREEGAQAGGPLRGVMHCFSSSRWMAEQALDIGFYLSFSGMLTFNKSDELRAIAADTPLDRVLVETDSPYLAPEPHRGGINQPAYVVHTAARLAQVHNLTRDEMAVITTRNFFTLFDRAKVAA